MKLLKYLKYSFPLIMILVAILCFNSFGGWDYIQVDSLRGIHKELLVFVKEAPYKAALFFFLGYVLFSLTILPGLLMFDLLGGFLFPQPYATLIIATACAVGGGIQFLAVRYAFSGLVKNSNKKIIEKIQKSVEKNQRNYLLLLRMVPIFPFGLLNFSIAVLRVRFSTFLWTTFVGAIPLMFFYTEAGRGLGLLLEQDGGITLSAVFNRPMVTSLVGLVVMLLIPLIYTQFKKARD